MPSNHAHMLLAILADIKLCQNYIEIMSTVNGSNYLNDMQATAYWGKEITEYKHPT